MSRPEVLHLQEEMALVEVDQAVASELAEFKGQAASLDGEVVGELLPGEGNIEFVRTEPLRFG